MAIRYSNFLSTLTLVLVTTVACHNPLPTQPSLQVPASLSVVSVTPRVAEVGSIVNTVIRGTGFQSGATVTMDGVVIDATFVNSAALNVRFPIHPAGVVDVVVTNPGGQDARLAAAFEYLPPMQLTVRLLSPSSGLVYGDMTNIIGTGFQSGAKVTFDGVQAVTTSVAPTIIFAFPPRHTPGPVDVVVTNPNGQSVTVNSGYTYQEVTLSVSAVQVAPGVPLTISWTAPDGRPPLESLGLFRVNDLETTLWSASTNGAPSGSRTLAAPAEPGQYQFAYLVEDDLIVVLSTIVTVSAPDIATSLGGRLSSR